MDKKKKLGNKGFSLVELIIVIAIMVLLVGLLAPQYIKYLDKSRIAADTQLADNVRQAMSTTLLDPNVTTIPDGTAPLGEAPSAGTAGIEKDYWYNVYEILGVSTKNDLISKLKYDNTIASGADAVDITYTITNGNVTVKVVGGKYKDNKKEITIN